MALVRAGSNPRPYIGSLLALLGVGGSFIDPGDVDGLFLHVDFGTATDLEDGDDIATWEAVVGGTLTASAANGIEYKTGDNPDGEHINNLPTAWFPGNLYFTTASGLMGGTTTDATAFAVYRRQAAGGTSEAVLASGATYKVYVDVSDLGNIQSQRSGGPSPAITGGSVLDEVTLVSSRTWELDGSTYVSSYKNLSAETHLVDAADRADVADGAWTIGSSGGSDIFGGHLAELAVYNVALSLSDRAAIAAGLMAKYGIAIAAPYAADDVGVAAFNSIADSTKPAVHPAFAAIEVT